MKSAHRSRLADIASEIATKGYFGRAQQRAARRKSPWNLLDLPVGFSCIALVGWGLLHAVWSARNSILPQHAIRLSAMFHSQRDQVAHIVLFTGVLFASIPVGVLISNLIVWSIPPYRRATGTEAKGIWHASFSDAQKDLSLMALVIGSTAIVASFIAALVMR
jgi:hypothetical protein